jgi:uncharacterized membrane protein YdbT with pleckstrin-like domain
MAHIAGMNPSDQPLPVTIPKHWAGYLAIFLVGAGVMGLLMLGLYESFYSPWADPMVMFLIAALVIFLVAAVTIVQLYVYSLSTLTLTQDGIVAVNYLTLFVKKDAQLEWVRVQQCSVVAGNIFAGLLGFASLNIQTAGGYQDARMTIVPNADYWQSVIQYYADLATPDGMDLSTSSAMAE